MKKSEVVPVLAALAREHRLDVLRLLVQAGPDGLAAGEVAERLGIPANSMTFHFDRLRHAGLITVRRKGRSMIYSAHGESVRGVINYLSKECC